MIEDEKIIALFFERSEQAIQELDIKYGSVFRKLSYNILNNRQDTEECVNDAYLGAWNAIPPAKPHPLLTYLCKIVRNISSENVLQTRSRETKQPLHNRYAGNRRMFIRSKHSGDQNGGKGTGAYPRTFFRYP